MQSFKAFQVLLLIAFSISPTSASFFNGPCSVDGTPGICITTGECGGGGGTSHPGFCPDTPDDVQCCTKSCGPYNDGICRFTNTCGGGIISNLCPGPNDFKCCVPGP